MPKTPITTEEEVLTPTTETVTPEVPEPRVWYNFPTIITDDGTPFKVQALTFEEAVKAKDQFLKSQTKSN